MATRTDFIVRGSDGRLFADKQKKLVWEIEKNEHAHSVCFPRTRFFKSLKSRRRRTTPWTRKLVCVATALQKQLPSPTNFEFTLICHQMYCNIVLTGRITGAACPFVCLSVRLLRAPNSNQNQNV